MDYQPGPYSVTFTSDPGDVQCIDITIAQDSVAEDSERFVVMLNLPGAAGPLVLSSFPEATVVTIEGKRNSIFWQTTQKSKVQT